MKLSNPSLFSALYDAALALGRARIPTLRISAGTMVLRIVEARHIPAGTGPVHRGTAMANLVVRDTHDDWNRFTGPPPARATASPAGGVYFALDPQALHNEALTYAKPKGGAANRDPNTQRPEDVGQVRLRPESDSPWLRAGQSERRTFPGWDATLLGRCVLHVRLTRTVAVGHADAPLFQALDRDVATRRALAGTCWPTVAHAVASADDYSAARALGLAVRRVGLDGLRVATARTLVGPPGENLVLFGLHGLPLAGAEVVEVEAFQTASNGIKAVRRPVS
jgi:hypothetical protein